MSLVGGDIDIRGGKLSTRNGQIDLVSVASKGEVATRGVPETKAFDQLGRIRIGKSRETGERSLVSAEGAQGRAGQGIFIRGGVFELSGGSGVETVVPCCGPKQEAGGDISIKTQESIVLSEDAFISTRTLSEGRAGSINLKTKRLEVSDAGIGSANFLGQVFDVECPDFICEQGNVRPLEVYDVRAFALESGIGSPFPHVDITEVGEGQTGAVFIQADRVSMVSTGRSIESPTPSAIATLTASNGDAGGIFMNVRQLDSRASSAIFSRSGVVTSQSNLEEGEFLHQDFLAGRGKGGDISLQATDFIRLTGMSLATCFPCFSFIETSTEGPGDAGRISITTPRVKLTESKISSSNMPTAGDDAAPAGDAGDIDLDVEQLKLDGGRIDSRTSSSGRAGDISINATGFVKLSGSSIQGGAQRGFDATTAGDPGTISITTPILSLGPGPGDGPFSSRIEGSGFGPGRGAVIRIRADDIRMTGSSIDVTAFGFGKGGSLDIRAKSIWLDGTSDLLSDPFLHQFIDGFGLLAFAGDPHLQFPGDTAPSGDIRVRTDSLRITNGAQINAATFDQGDGGNVTINAKSIVLDGSNVLGPSGIVASTSVSGQGGDVAVDADTIELHDGAQISASTFGSGRGGNLDVTATSMRLAGGDGNFRSGLLATAEEGSSGEAGSIDVRTHELAISGGAQINATTFGTGKGGNLTVHAKDILLQGIDSGFPSGILASSGAGSSANGGELNLTSESLTVTDGASISAETFGIGRGGDLSVAARDILLSDGGAISAASNSASVGAGSAGTLTISALDSLRLFDDSEISVGTAQAEGGDIDIQAGSLLHLRDSRITTSVAGGLGSGGNILIDPIFVILDSSQIVANAFEGRGGNIRIVSDFFFASPDSLVDASSELGISGSVVIDSPETDLTGGITALPESFLDATALLRERCGVRAVSEQSSLVIRGGSIPPEPDRYLSASYKGGPGSASVQLGIPDKAKRNPARVAEGLELGCGN